MLNSAQSVILCVVLCLLFSIVQVYFLFYFLGGNAHECLFTLINQQGLLTKFQDGKKEAEKFVAKTPVEDKEAKNFSNKFNRQEKFLAKSPIGEEENEGEAAKFIVEPINEQVVQPGVRQINIKDNQQKQQKQQKKQEIVLFVLILSSNKTTSRRQAVRNTWATKQSGLSFNYVFVLAQEEQNEDILIEKDQYQDMLLLEGVGGAYRQLTGKVLQAIIHCNTNFSYKYLLKTDDDSFVNVKAILEQIDIIQQKYNEGDLIFAGKPHQGIKITTGGKWGDQKFKKQSHLERYPPYMQGGGYLTSRSITEFLTESEQKYGLKRAISEDVAMGLWLFGLNVTRINWNKMLKINFPRLDSKTLQAQNISIDVCTKLVIHRTQEQQMVKFFNELQNCSSFDVSDRASE